MELYHSTVISPSPTDHVLTKAALLDQLAEFHIVIGPHRNEAVATDGTIHLGAHKIECTNANMPWTLRVARFPRLGVEAEEQCERATKHAQQSAGHLQLRCDGEVIEVLAAQVSRPRG